jgi:hypothetical protein
MLPGKKQEKAGEKLKTEDAGTFLENDGNAMQRKRSFL